MSANKINSKMLVRFKIPESQIDQQSVAWNYEIRIIWYFSKHNYFADYLLPRKESSYLKWCSPLKI